ncbi:uncharacterized protein LOC142318456 isoform X1 [Lycorma delicatula]|uniref:uncharacterized protein LOC142318456 isoform X1 n=1 Tax=Lycorma delicatula TaxID=130591 RepID=UPI003F50DDF7
MHKIYMFFSVLETNKDLKVAESQLLVGFCNPSPPVTTTPSSPRIMEDEENGNIVKQNNKTSNGDSTDDSKMFATKSYPLKRSEAVDTNDYKKLNSGISRATDNVNLVSQVRSELVLDNIEQDFFVETPVHTFILPDISSEEPASRFTTAERGTTLYQKRSFNN